MGAELGDAISQANHSDDVTAMVLTALDAAFARAQIFATCSKRRQKVARKPESRPTRNWVERFANPTHRCRSQRCY